MLTLFVGDSRQFESLRDIRAGDRRLGMWRLWLARSPVRGHQARFGIVPAI
jgi:hypothetical protein